MIKKMIETVEGLIVRGNYREFEFEIEREDLLTAIDNNNEGALVPGSSVVYKIDSFRRIDKELLVSLKAADIEIDKATIVTNLVDKIQEKGKGMSHVQVILGSDKEYDSTGKVIAEEMDNYISYVRLPENLASRKKVFNFVEATLRDGKSYHKVSLDSKNPATFDILSVKYGDSEMQGDLILKHGIYMHTDKYGMYSFYKQQGRYLIELESGNKIELNSIDKSFKHYVPFGASPSNERQNTIYMIDVSDGQDKANKALYTLTYGAYDLNSLGEDVEFSALAKMSSRWFQWMAPSTSMGLVEAYAIYCGKFNNDVLDGEAFRRASSISKHVFNKYGIRIDQKVLQGMFEQSRDGQSKVGDIPLGDKLFDASIYHLDNDPIFFTREEITQDIQEDIENGMRGKGKYAGRVVCIGSHSLKDVETLYDTNGMKSSFDFTQQLEYTLLRILRNNPSNLSKSIFEKMLAKDSEKAIEIVKSLLTEDVFERINRAYLSAEPKVLSPDSFTKDNWYLDEIISSYAPKYLKMDRNFSLNVIDNQTKAVNKIMNKLKVPMNGRNSGITVGIESLFGLDGILGNHEVISPAAERMFKKEGVPEEEWDMFVIKYPSMDINEYSVFRVISKREVKNRLRKLDVDKSLINLFVDYYMTLHDSVMVVPSCELFKNKHAGSDFDTDQVAWSINKEIVSVLRQDEDNNIAVVIK